MKSCVLTCALIWNQPELYTSYWDGVLSILLKAKNDLWISWEFGVVRPIELNFLPEAYLTKITHPWKFQLKRTILSGKFFLRGGALKEYIKDKSCKEFCHLEVSFFYVDFVNKIIEKQILRQEEMKCEENFLVGNIL